MFPPSQGRRSRRLPCSATGRNTQWAGVGLIVAATIRTDRYEAMQTAPGLAALDTQLFDQLKPMPATEFKEVIVGPAARATEAGQTLRLEPELVDRLIADCTEGADTLPLMSLTLSRLYTDFGTSGTLTLAQYEAMGGLAHVVQTEIDGVLSSDRGIRADQLTALRAAFIPWLATINPENDQPLRRVARWADLPENSRPLIDALVAKRLMVKDERGGGVVVEVALESLLRQWDALAGWLRDERENLREADNLERAAAAWQKSGRDDAWLLQGTRLGDAETLSAASGFRDRLLPMREYLWMSRQRENDRQNAERQRQEAEVRTAREHAAAMKKRARVLQAVLALAVVVALVAVFGVIQASRANSRARDALREATSGRLTSEAQSMLAGAQSGEDIRAFQELLAADAIAKMPDRGALLNALVTRFGALKLIDTGTETRFMALSPNGRLIATSGNKEIRIWDAGTGQQIGNVLAVTNGVAFSRNNQYLASASADAKVLLWDPYSGELLRTFTGPKNTTDQGGLQPHGRPYRRGQYGWHGVDLGCRDRQGTAHPRRARRPRGGGGIQSRRQPACHGWPGRARRGVGRNRREAPAHPQPRCRGGRRRRIHPQRT